MRRVIHGEDQLSMRVAVHGQPVELRWRNRVLSGNADVVSRVERLAAEHGTDLNDPVAMLTCLELALAMRPEVHFNG